MAKLVLSLNGALQNQYFTDRPLLRIGRSADNEIIVNDPALTEFHACIRCVGEDHILEDLSGSEGIPVNGKPSSRQILQHLDTIQLGVHHLRYLNSRVAAQISLDHTMLIQALPGNRESSEIPGAAPGGMRVGRPHFPEGYIRLLSANGQHATGDIVPLTRVITTFGTPGKQRVVLTQRPQGFFLSLIEGASPPKVNQRATTGKAVALQEGDIIEVEGCRLEFHLGSSASQTLSEQSNEAR